MHAPTVPVFKTGKGSSVGNYRLIAIRNIFPKVFEFIIHGHVFEVGFTLPEVHATPEMSRIFKTPQEMEKTRYVSIIARLKSIAKFSSNRLQ
jgi:hypothetical protein